MKSILNKCIYEIKEFLNKSVKFNLKILIVTAIVFIVALFTSYNIGSFHKLNKLVEYKAQETVENLKLSDDTLQTEIKKLSSQQDELNSSLSEKSNIQTTMQQYNTDKANYTEQSAQLTDDINKLDTSIQKKQSELNEKKAAKAEELRIAAERAAAEAEADRQANMVWIGDTGTKYHYQSCRTLRGNKYQITLAEAQAQGRTACKVCH